MSVPYAPPEPKVTPERVREPSLCHIRHEGRVALCGVIGKLMVLPGSAYDDRNGRCAYCYQTRCPRCAALFSEGVR